MEKHGLAPEDLSSVVLIEGNRAYQRSTAALRIARRLTGGWRLLYPLILVPRFLRDAVYQQIANHRYRWFGKSETCPATTPDRKARFL
jgi:predicted DCC family thiol-disulfide oxidoreductase YuxK